MAAKEKIKVFYSPACGHCKDIVDKIQAGNVVVEGNEGTEVQLIDADQSDVRELISEGIALVPTARYKGKTCKLLIDDIAGKAIIQCDKVEEVIATESEAIQGQ